MANSPRNSGIQGDEPVPAGDVAAYGDKYRLQSVERALDALEFLALAGADGITLTQASDQLRISKSSAFALLQTLIARGFASDSGARQNRRYRLGMAVAKLGDAAAAQVPLVDVATPVLRSVTETTGLTTRLVVPDGPYAVVIARVDAPGSVRFASYLGKREYPHCTSAGKALLAAMAPERARELAVEAGMPARTPRTITDPEALLRDLALAAVRGYTIDDEEDAEGVFCVGAPVRDRTGNCVAAISGTGLKLNRPSWRMDELGLLVRDAADTITAALGGPPFAVPSIPGQAVAAEPLGAQLEPR